MAIDFGAIFYWKFVQDHFSSFIFNGICETVCLLVKLTRYLLYSCGFTFIRFYCSPKPRFSSSGESERPFSKYSSWFIFLLMLAMVASFYGSFLLFNIFLPDFITASTLTSVHFTWTWNLGKAFVEDEKLIEKGVRFHLKHIFSWSNCHTGRKETIDEIP